MQSITFRLYRHCLRIKYSTEELRWFCANTEEHFINSSLSRMYYGRYSSMKEFAFYLKDNFSDGGFQKELKRLEFSYRFLKKWAPIVEKIIEKEEKGEKE